MKNLKNASGNFNELLFEKRNKQYGAYVIRKEYDESLVKSFFAALLSLLLFAGIFAVLNRKNAAELILPMKQDIEQIKIEVDLRNLIPEKQVKPIEHPAAKPVTRAPKQDVVAEVKDNVVPVDDLKKEDDNPIKSNIDANAQTGVDEIHPISETGNANAETGLGAGLEEQIKKQAELDVQPEFPGGYSKLMDFLSHTIVYPAIAKENGIKGTVYVSFKVDKLGKVSDVKLLRGLYSACDAEVIRVVKLFPDWKPGVYQGRNVSVLFSLPVTFELRN